MAQAAYARNPIPQVPVSDFRVLGGSIYATAPGAMGLSWKGEAMWMPRVSGAYTLGERTVIKGGYGLFYDTLNAGDYTGFNQLGYSSATTNVSSTDFGRSWLLGDPVNGITPLVDPFPVRVGGGRFEEPIEDALGVDAILGTNFTREDPNRSHPRVQRWRIGVQREVVRNLAVEVAYTGSYADRVGRQIAESYVPEQYYSSVTNVRDATQQSLLQQQVPNPFNIANFASLATTNPTLYQRHGRQLVLHRDDDAAAEPDSRLPAAVGVELREPAARRRQGSRARDHADPPLFGRPQRQRGVCRAPGDGEPDR